MKVFKTLVAICMLCISLQACLQEDASGKADLLTGAKQTDQYLPLLKDKKVALVANHASLIDKTHLADSLLSLDVALVKVFAPEHGFRGIADAGELIDNEIDKKTGLPVVSLYGSNKKPSKESLENIDIILFDLQDVGARFYTYIYTLTYVMEAAAEIGIPVILLDRPNPNGFYVDGPVLEKGYASFVGMHPVPVVYGMTIGEYGRMVNGEYWMADSLQCDLTVVPLKNYNRSELYRLPVRPSPNLPNWQSVYLYPSLCLFEGTVVSVGRGTDYPFTVYGHPDFHPGSFAFTPEPRQGAKHPKLQGEQCFGQNLEEYAKKYGQVEHHFNLSWLINAFEVLGSDSSFFTPYFDKLAGTSLLREQIISGTSLEKIRSSWQEHLDTFMEIRKKYLIYKDF
jgi:uncharacterized protein YbbC (DUF1343 family)